MDVAGKVVVVTGGGGGIGAALCRAFAAAGARAVVAADIDAGEAEKVAAAVNAGDSGTVALGVGVDAGDEASVTDLVARAEAEFGPIDLFCANAGIGVVGDEQSDPSTWQRMWEINTMSHVHAARHLIPGWVARGEGYFLVTASAAGLLTNLKAAQYSVTKHAAVAFAEWLAITYGDAGVKVSALCPQFVNTPLLEGSEAFQALGANHTLEPFEVAEAVVSGLSDESFLILPHPEVEKYFRNKANDYERWLGGMRKLQQTVFPDG